MEQPNKKDFMEEETVALSGGFQVEFVTKQKLNERKYIEALEMFITHLLKKSYEHF